MDEGKLLGHIISKNGIHIDPTRVETIQQIDLPRNKKEIQSFNGKMNFLCRFVPNLAEHLRQITNMLKKGSQVKWMEEAVKSFNLVKLALSSAPIDPKGRQGEWIAALLEYDVEIKPTKLLKGQGLAKLMDESNLHALDINLIAAMSDENEEGSSIQVSRMFVLSSWYLDIIYVLQNLSPPLGMTRNKSRTLKLKAAKFCILNSALYWKDPGGVLLNCLVEEEAKQVMEDFHKGDCGGHLFWKTTTNKFLRAGYYWPTLFADVYKVVKSCHKCQRRWILMAKDYFTKWIEEIPTRQATNAVIISFLENNILSRFGFPNKLVTDNATTFRSKKMIEFCNKYKIILGHSTTYHSQGNGLAESSNKSLVNIIKKLLEINKKSWHKKLVNALWVDQVSQNKSIGMSPFELVYGIDTVFPTSLAAPVVKLLKEASSEEDHMQRRLNQMVHLQQTREEFFLNTSKLQEKIKKIYDRKQRRTNSNWRKWC
eukprot:PITA_16307